MSKLKVDKLKINRLKIISKYFIKGSIDGMFGNSKFNPWFLIMCMFGLFAVVSIPMSIMVASSYEPMHQIGQESLLLSTIVSLGATVSFLFGIYIIMDVFYFSNDIEQILPLPFKSSDILIGKFISVLINMYIYMSMIILPLIKYGIVSKANFIYYFYIIIVVLLAPIVPIILASLICIFLMRFTSLSKHKDMFRTISGILSLVLGVGFNTLSRSSGRNSPNMAQILSNKGANKINVIDNIFITNKISSYGLIYNNEFKGFIYILASVILSAILLYLYYRIAGRSYLKGIIGLSESYSKKKDILKDGKLKGFIKVNSPMKALVIRDIKNIFRTPQLFINCIAMILYLPAILLVTSSSASSIYKARNIIAESPKYYAMVLAICFIGGSLCVMTGGAGTTALTRDVKDFTVLKYIPISYKVHLKSKIISCLCINEIGSLVVLSGLILVRANIILIILGTILSFNSIAFVTMIGIYMDFKSPKLDWEDEKDMFRKRYSSLLIMLFIFIIGIVSVILAEVIKNYLIVFAILMTFIAIILVVMYKKLLKLAYEIY